MRDINEFVCAVQQGGVFRFIYNGILLIVALLLVAFISMILLQLIPYVGIQLEKSYTTYQIGKGLLSLVAACVGVFVFMVWRSFKK